MGIAYPNFPILIVDDERIILDAFEITLVASGYTNIITFEDSRKVLPFLEKNPVQLVLLDLVMPHINGLELLTKIKQQFPDTKVIIITAISEIESVVHCMRTGAIDYVLKPTDSETLVSKVRRCMDQEELERENALLRESILTEKLRHPEVFEEIITETPAMFSIFRYCEAIATSRKPVVITGETGTGKELVARAIHQLSGRKGEFVAINVASLDDAMFADTLFGHVKGAYTGADQARKGLIASAWDGTLFLDEIGDLSLTSQVKLLRLLQEEKFFPIGSDVPKTANIRVITSTLKDLKKLKQEKLFREDLYFRLSSHHVHLPPLRDRQDDIPLLLHHFLHQEAQESGKKVPRIPQKLVSLLRSYSFPGNIREFQAMVTDAFSCSPEDTLDIKVFHRRMENAAGSGLPESVECPFSEADSLRKLPRLKDAQDKLARALIAKAMSLSGGNQTIASRYLGITQQALSFKLQKFKRIDAYEK